MLNSNVTGNPVFNGRKLTVVSSAPTGDITHNVMKVLDPKFNLKSLVPPVRMVRDKPELRKKPEEASSTDAAANGKDKLDPSKVAPYGGAMKNRQNLFKKRTKIYTFSLAPDADADSSAPRKPKRDPDRFPYILSDFEGTQQYTGNLEGGQDTTYMMFVMQGNKLKAIPVSKWYKFTAKPKYRTLTTEEAEEKMKQQTKKKLNTWFMHQEANAAKAEGSASKPKGEGEEEKEKDQPKKEKAYMKKMFGGDETKVRRQRDRRDDDAAELDFEEEFADDEDMMLFGENEEEAKDAMQRQYGKHGKRSGFLDEDDDDDDDDEDRGRKGKSAVAKDLKKVLRKVHRDVDHSDEDNPYISDMEESDEDEANTQDTIQKEDAKKGKEGKSRGPAAGLGRRLGSASPATSPEQGSQAGKKKTLKVVKAAAAGSRAASPLGRASSTSPVHGSSPMGGGQSGVGKKRKGAASSDEETAEKKPRMVSTSSATELLQVLGGRATSPPQGGSSSSSARTKLTGRPKTGSSKSTPVVDSAAGGVPAGPSGSGRSTPSGQSGVRGTPGSGSGTTGKRKAPTAAAGVAKKAKGTTASSPLAEGASSQRGVERETVKKAIIEAFRRKNTNRMNVGDLVKDVRGIVPNPSAFNSQAASLVIKAIATMETDAKTGKKVAVLKAEFED